MRSIEKFIAWLTAQLKSIYVWGAQGEYNLTDEQIRRMETNSTNADRAIALKRKRQAEGMKDIRAFDCSGLVVCYLLENGYIKSDSTAAGLYEKCKKLTKADLKAGDFVFRYNGTKIHHVGVYIDDEMVIHSKGRDAGVVKEHIDYSGESYWNRYGRFEPLQEGETEMAKVITKTSPLTRGDDIKKLQTALNALGYDCGTADGIAGDKTLAAIQKFAAAHGRAMPNSVTVTAKVGSKTYSGTAK